MRTIRFIISGLIIPVILTAQDDVFSKLPEYKGFSKRINPTVYVPENLWDYIDGAADVYLGLGFTDLHMADYYKNKKQNLRVEIYRHSDRKNAFGIYANERFPDYNFINLGVQGYQQKNVLNFFCDVYYIKIYGNSEDELILKAMKEIASRIALNLGGYVGFPEILERFPKEGKISNSESFIGVNFMGYDFYSSVFVSEYKSGDNIFRIFVMEAKNPEECRKTILNHIETAHGNPETVKQGIIKITDPYNGLVWINWKGSEIWGIMDLNDDNLALKYLEIIAGNQTNNKEQVR